MTRKGSQVRVLYGPPPTFEAHRILAGSSTSSDDDRAEHPPVRPAGVEQGPDPVVLEVAEPEADALDALDQVVERLGRSVGHLGQVVVAELVEPLLDRSPELLHLGRHGPLETVGLKLSEDPAGFVGVLGLVEVPEPLLDAI